MIEQNKLKLEKLVEKKAQNGHIILTMSNWSYRAVLINWLVYMNMLGELDRTVVLSLDSKIQTMLGENIGVPFYAKNCNGKLTLECKKYILKVRHYAILKALQVSYEKKKYFYVTWSDTDCIWLPKLSYLLWLDQYKYKSYTHNPTFYAQRGKQYLSFFPKIGSVACNGLFTLTPSNNSINFMKEVLSTLEHTKDDDQATFNYVAYNGGAFNFSKKLQFRSSYETRIDYSNTMSKYSIGLLNFQEFPRDTSTYFPLNKLKWCNDKNTPHVWHNQAPKEQESKLKLMKKENVLIIDKNWKKVENSKDLKRYISAKTVYNFCKM